MNLAPPLDSTHTFLPLNVQLHCWGHHRAFVVFFPIASPATCIVPDTRNGFLQLANLVKADLIRHGKMSHRVRAREHGRLLLRTPLGVLALKGQLTTIWNSSLRVSKRSSGLSRHQARMYCTDKHVNKTPMYIKNRGKSSSFLKPIKTINVQTNRYGGGAVTSPRIMKCSWSLSLYIFLSYWIKCKVTNSSWKGNFKMFILTLWGWDLALGQI